MAIKLSEKQMKDGWQIVRFGEIAKQCKDSVDRENNPFERYVEGGHMDTENLRIMRWGEFGDHYVGPAFHRIFRKGQILYGSRRTYLKKVAVANFDGITANTTFVIDPQKPNILVPGLLPFIMLSEDFTNHSVLNSKGSTNPYINWGDIAKYEFPLPPIKRQQEILRVLEKMELISLKNEALIQNGEFLSRLILQKKTYHIDTDKQKVTLSQIATIVNSPVDKKTKKGESSVKLCNYMDAYNNREITSEIDFMRASASQNEINKFSLYRGDVVITKDSETPDDIGVPTFIAEDIPDLVCGYHLAILRPNKTVSGKYLSYVLSSSKARHDFAPYAQGITRFGLSSDAYKTIKIYRPSLEEQNKIYIVLDHLHEILDNLKKQAQRYTRKKRLILQKFLLNRSLIEGDTQ